MIQPINLHTHSTFCDGKNSPEEMILAAINKGFTELGFSGHGMYPFASDWHISAKEYDSYTKEIKRLAEKYQNQIKIHLGFEADFIPGITVPSKENYSAFSPEYLIGSVHYVNSAKGPYAVDDSTENVKNGLEKLYNNNGKEIVCRYFELQRQMLKEGDFEIWGHPDLVRKRNGQLNFFDENESWYKDELAETAKAAAAAGVIAEINTGAIARGVMNDFYPSEYFLSLLYNAGVPVMINSDCHNASDLDCAFDKAAAAAKKVGFKELTLPQCCLTKSIKL